MHKVSFDFDDTLSEPKIQKLARTILESGLFTLWIVTARVPTEKAGSPTWNDDLFGVAKDLGIPQDRIVFCAYSPKYEWFLNNEDFLFHIDDDPEEIRDINIHTKVRGIHLC